MFSVPSPAPPIEPKYQLVRMASAGTVRGKIVVSYAPTAQSNTSTLKNNPYFASIPLKAKKWKTIPVFFICFLSSKEHQSWQPN
jgi:hypothetical protein